MSNHDHVGQTGFGDRLKAVRTHLRLTQKEMADLLGIHVNSISQYERETVYPQVTVISELAEKGIDLTWLLTGNGRMLRETAPVVGPIDVATGPDPKIFRSIVDGLSNLFRDLNQKVAAGQLAERAAEMYPEIAAVADESERRGALAYALSQTRKELLQAASGEVTTKRLA